MSNTRMDNLRMVDPVLTTIAHGYTNEALIYNEIFPEVQVSKLKGKIPIFGKDAFILRDTLRAARAESNRIAPSDLELVEFETQERDIETAVDYLEEEESADFFNYEQHVTKELSDILQLGKEKSAADIVQNPNNFASDLKLEITSEFAFDNSSSSSNPIELIRDAINSLRLKIGRYPNTMIIGHSTYMAMMNHQKLVELAQYVSKTTIDTKFISSIFDIQHVHIGKSVYSNDGEGFQDIWQDNIVLAYVDKSKKKSEYNPSFGYTFQREGMPEVDTYFENGGKVKIIRCTDNYTQKITGSEAAFLIYNTNHN